MTVERTPAEVAVQARSAERLASLVGPEQMAELHEALADACKVLNGRVVWNLNSTATGGGVAEILRVLMPYLSGAGIATRWLVIQGDPRFLSITKRLTTLCTALRGMSRRSVQAFRDLRARRPMVLNSYPDYAMP